MSSDQDKGRKREDADRGKGLKSREVLQPEPVSEKGNKVDGDGKIRSDSEEDGDGPRNLFEEMGMDNYADKNAEAVYSWGRD